MKLPPIGFGTWAWGNKFLWGYEKGTKDDVLVDTFKTAVEGGLNFIDTADSYGTGRLKGRSEELIGKSLKRISNHKLKNIIIATKLAPYPWRIGRRGFHTAFKESKKRLQGKVDLVQLHWSTSRYAPWQEVQLIDGLADLVEDGLIKAIGVSNMGPVRLQFFHDRLLKRGVKLKSIQIQFSLLSPEPNKTFELKKICKQLNISVIAYSPLALGILAVPPETNKVPSSFIRRQLFKSLLPTTRTLREELSTIASQHNCTQSQVALNWCRAHGAIPIPGLQIPFQAMDAIKATKWRLTDNEKRRLDILSLQCKRLMPNNPFQSK